MSRQSGFGLTGFAVMVAYLVAGPDGMPNGQPLAPPAPREPQSAECAHAQ